MHRARQPAVTAIQLESHEVIRIMQAMNRIRQVAKDVRKASDLQDSGARRARLLHLTMVHDLAAVEVLTTIGMDMR